MSAFSYGQSHDGGDSFAQDDSIVKKAKVKEVLVNYISSIGDSFFFAKYIYAPEGRPLCQTGKVRDSKIKSDWSYIYNKNGEKASNTFVKYEESDTTSTRTENTFDVNGNQILSETYNESHELIGLQKRTYNSHNDILTLIGYTPFIDIIGSSIYINQWI